MERRPYRVTVEFSVPASVELGPESILAGPDGVPSVLVTLGSGLWPILRLRLDLDPLGESWPALPAELSDGALEHDYETTEGLGGT